MIGPGIWAGWQLVEQPEPESEGEASLGTRQRAKKYQNQVACLRVLESHCPQLVRGEPGVCLGDREISAIRSALSRGEQEHAARTRHNFFVEGLVRGVRELAWDIPVPAPLWINHQEEELLTATAFRDLADYRRVEQAFWTELGRPEATVGDARHYVAAKRVDAGRLIFSAISNGMLLNKKWLRALPHAIIRGVQVHQGYEHRPVSLDLRMADITDERSKIDFQSSVRIRRWFPDPVTALLLLRWYRRYGCAWPKESNENLLKRYLAHGEVKGKTRWTLPRLLKKAKTASLITFPTFVARYAWQLELGASVPVENSIRLETGMAPPVKLQPIEQKIDSRSHRRNVQSVPEFRRPAGAPDQLELYRALLDCLASKAGKRRGEKEVKKALAQFYSDHGQGSPILALIAHWLSARIKINGRVRSKTRNKTSSETLQVSSAQRHFSSIGKVLLVAAQEHPDIGSYDGSDWEWLYEEAMHSTVSSEQRGTRRAALLMFHGWLMERYGVPLVHIEGETAGLRNVDAHVLTPREFRRACRWLGTSSTTRLATIRTLILTLGYRCGLRRSEVASLTLRDLPGLLEPGCTRSELLVRTNRYARGKTVSSTRRLPLWLMLMPEELNQLRGWLRRRNQEEIGNDVNALLFCGAGTPFWMMTNQEAFVPIQRAMTNATGNPAIRFHHNRHSFASFTLLRMMEATPGEYLPAQWRQDDDGSEALPRWGDDFCALARLGRAGAPTRKHLWTLAIWCGHVDPSETQTSYAHSLDWLLGTMVRVRRDRTLTASEQAHLLDVAVSGLDVFRSRKRLMGKTTAGELLRTIAERWHGFQAKPNLARWRVPDCPELEDAAQSISIDPLGLIQMLRHVEKRQEQDQNCIASIADLYDVSPAKLSEWLVTVSALAKLETERGTSRTARKEVRVAREKESSTSVRAPSVPGFFAEPRTHRSCRRSVELFRRVEAYYEAQPELVLRFLREAVKRMQRSKTAWRFRDSGPKRDFLALLDALQLKAASYVGLTLDVTMDKTAAVAYWSEELSIPKSRIRAQRVTQERPFNRVGVAQIDFVADASGERTTWTELRFALLGAVVLLPSADERDYLLAGV